MIEELFQFPRYEDWQSWPIIGYKVLTILENGDMASLNINNKYTVIYRERQLVKPVLVLSPLWIYLDGPQAVKRFESHKLQVIRHHRSQENPIDFGVALYQVRAPSVRKDYTCSLPTRASTEEDFAEFWQSPKQYPLDWSEASRRFGLLYPTQTDIESTRFVPCLVLERRLDAFLIKEYQS